jgi:acyl-[acyl-carrier-protein]-phospholipid O-acyltransferase/long-chain-fatty-acid--[acyl-carrier-protein] ligase
MSSAETTAEAVTEHLDTAHLPTLYADRSFWGMVITQFLGAFNDNLFKQLILLLSITVAVGGAAEDKQGTATLIFSLPFLLVTGIAGYLSDRYPKRRIVVLCKVAEVVIMALGALAFSLYSQSSSLLFLYGVLFLMGSHSGFFGPAKYGILPEILRDDDLPRANGFILMTTFVAIIAGTVVAGFILDFFPGKLWVGSSACILTAVLGTLSAMFVRKVPPANPQLQLQASSFAVPPDMLRMLLADRPLHVALWVSSMFWLLAGLVPNAINALGKIELQIGDKRTSYLNGVISIGIALGCVIGGLASRGKVDFRLLRMGAIGMMLCLAVLAIPADGDISLLVGKDGVLEHLPGIGESAQWLGFWGSLVLLLFLGAFTGLFAVPLQVFMQTRPPDDKKGRMIAVMNQANWIGIAISGVLYNAFAAIIAALDWPRSTTFLFIAALMLPIALFYHPKNELLSDH